jgi:hypothetical protein
MAGKSLPWLGPLPPMMSIAGGVDLKSIFSEPSSLFSPTRVAVGVAAHGELHGFEHGIGEFIPRQFG